MVILSISSLQLANIGCWWDPERSKIRLTLTRQPLCATNTTIFDQYWNSCALSQTQVPQTLTVRVLIALSTLPQLTVSQIKQSKYRVRKTTKIRLQVRPNWKVESAPWL